jgi:hypothetical protein
MVNYAGPMANNPSSRPIRRPNHACSTVRPPVADDPHVLDGEALIGHAVDQPLGVEVLAEAGDPLLVRVLGAGGADTGSNRAHSSRPPVRSEAAYPSRVT